MFYFFCYFAHSELRIIKASYKKNERPLPFRFSCEDFYLYTSNTFSKKTSRVIVILIKCESHYGVP